MTDDYTSGSPQPEGPASTADVVKEQAGSLKDTAAGAGEHLLGEARGEAAAVAQEARRQVDDLWSQARSELSGQVGSQQSRLAGGLSSIGANLTQMSSAPDERNLATEVVREVGERVDAVGRWLEARGPEEVLDEVQRFARRRPGTFLLVAAGAGVVLGRLTRGLKDAGASGPTPTERPEAGPTPTGTAEVGPQLDDEGRSPVPSTSGWDQR